MWDVRAAIREWALPRHGLITYERALALGATPSQLSRWCNRGWLVRLQPRVYLLAELLDDYSHLAAACQSRPGTAASHRAAAWLSGFDGVDVHVVEVSVAEGRGPMRGITHRAADLAALDVTTIQGIPCTNATRTLCDIGAVVDVDTVEVMLESALRMGLTRLPRLEWRAGALARSGRRGPNVLLDVLERRPQGAVPTESFLETKFHQLLRARGIPLPVRQYEVRDENGRFVARLDNAYVEAMVWFELDGRGAHGPSRFVRDRERQNDLVYMGWRPQRFTYSHVMDDPDGTAARTEACRLRFSSH